jgi:hypothetical protein
MVAIQATTGDKMPLAVIRAQWSGFPGAPGVTTFYDEFTGSVPPLAAYTSFFGNFAAGLPNSVRIQVASEGLVLDTATGLANASYAGTAQTVVSGGDVSPYPAPTGAVVNWLTNAFVGGHRVRGRSFIVPLGGTQYQTDGSLRDVMRTEIQTSATQLIAAANPTVVSRNGGWQAATIASSSVPDIAAVLRSRRG